MKGATTGFMVICMMFLFKPGISNAQTGSIRGQVKDSETMAPLPGTNVMIKGTDLGSACDAEGRFTVDRVPVGSYTVRFSYMGYSDVLIPDVIVKSGRITTADAGMKPSVLELGGVTVTGDYFSQTESQPTSSASFSFEEIRRAPGSGGDVSRIILGLPSLAKVNDQSNSLIVRGGSPIENAFYIDNIEIPNINHFPNQGASGGPLGLVNVDFIQDVTFLAGGFSAAYGNRLSSVMDIRFREGNRSELDGQLDLNFAGFGFVLEGPLPSSKGSWLVSARRSYFDLIGKIVDIGSTVPPHWGDYQWKINCDLSGSHRLTLLGVWADDHNDPDEKAAVESDMIYYGTQDIYERTTGVNWRALWNRTGYSNTSVSWTAQEFREDFLKTGSNLPLIRNRSKEGAFRMRNVNHFRINGMHSLEFGFEAESGINRYDNLYGSYPDFSGEPVPALQVKQDFRAHRLGCFAILLYRPHARITTQFGIRVDHDDFSRETRVSPRLSFSWRLNSRTSLNGSTGLFHQGLPLILLGQAQDNRNLKDPSAVHVVFGIEHLLTESTRLTLEWYRKTYSSLPMDPDEPSLSLLDELSFRYGFFANHGSLTDGGQAFSQGIELMIQKRLARDFYGMAGASIFQTRYRDGLGVWRDRVYDNRFIFSVEGGYKPGRNWEFSARWIFAGGTPYTPFDAERSTALNRAVLDQGRINQARYPAYHSLNLRFDRRFHFSRSNLIAYVSVWNAYNRKNVASFFWDEVKNAQGAIYQWSLMPVIGLEFEF